jgi:UDP-N-acetyl-D-glucosamine dehydrogenase
MTSIPLTAETLKEADLVLLVTDHAAYDYHWIAAEAKLIVDTRNAFKGQSGEHIFMA